MRKVVIESPFAGKGETEAERAADLARNIRYLRACMHDCFERGEAPYASHGLYPQPGVLDDGDAADRELGINAGFAWREDANATVVYTDLGTSTGMKYGIAAAEKLREEQREAWFDVFGYAECDKRVTDEHRAAADRSISHKIEYRTLGADWEQRAIEREASFKTKWPEGEVMLVRSSDDRRSAARTPGARIVTQGGES